VNTTSASGYTGDITPGPGETTEDVVVTSVVSSSSGSGGSGYGDDDGAGVADGVSVEDWWRQLAHVETVMRVHGPVLAVVGDSHPVRVDVLFRHSSYSEASCWDCMSHSPSVENFSTARLVNRPVLHQLYDQISWRFVRQL